MNESVWQAVLDRERNAIKDGLELDMVDDETDEEELEEEVEDDWGDREFVSDISGDEYDDNDVLSDLEDVVRVHKQPKKKAQSKQSIYTPAVSSAYVSTVDPRVEVEYENEMESLPISKSALASW